MIDLTAMKFKKYRSAGDSGATIIRATLVLEAEMHIAPGLGEQKPEYEAYVKEGLSRVIQDQVYGDLRDYIHLMRAHVRSIAPDPRYTGDYEGHKKIEELEKKFEKLL